MKLLPIKFIVILNFLYSCNNEQKEININKSYCLNNSTKAIQLAEEKWLKIYGEKIFTMEPFNASLKNDTIWVVKGTLEKGKKGGTPYAEFNAKNCNIILITHYK